MSQSISLTEGSSIPNENVVERVALVMAMIILAHFAFAWPLGVWIADGDGKYMVQDFVAFWTAGRQAFEGQAAAAYDPVAAKAAQEVSIGYAYKGEYPWFYPPFYFFLLIPLSFVPFGIAYFSWVAISTLAYVRVVGGIVGHRFGYLLALAFPGVFFNMLSGQNGALTATLIGATLALMQRHPVASGICLGLMTYKPHFGVLFPLVLIANRRWTVIVSATLTALFVGGLSWMAFGGDAWIGFFKSLFTASDVHITEGSVKWHKIQSVYALLRMAGVGEAPALAVHLVMLAIIAVALWQLWRRDVAFNLKAAGLAVAIPLATPYLMIYDSIVLAVPMAFLIREGRRTGFLPREWIWLGVSVCVIATLPFVGFPSVFIAAFIIVALVARRASGEVPNQLVTRDA